MRGVPPLDGTLNVRGPDAPIEIFRDSLGIPHVRARTTHDAFFGQGFVHAQDRLWQMCYDRRRADGRLAEWLGPRAAVMDVFVRRLGIAASAQLDHDHFDEETRAVLDAYASGVNAFLSTDPPMPLELQLLEEVVEPWEAWHCGSVLKVRHVLMGTFDNKLWRQRLLDALGPSGVIAPGSPHEREDLLIVPVGATERYVANFALESSTLPDGSNNWAVHGSRTASGKPLVAGDPHRTLEAPNVYYQNHIACPEFDAIGFSMAGVPGMFHFGHNEHMAWCVTHGMADTQDLYIERPEDILEKRRDRIEVRGAPDIEFDIEVTRRGPVIGDNISMRWTGIDRPNSSLQTILPALRAKNVREFDEVMRDWVDPCNNVVMADKDGHIAYLYRGRTPIRSTANAWTPVPGWTGEHEWKQDVPYEEQPRLLDPDGGIIVTANNRVVGSDYPYLLGTDYSQPGRARRVLERLQEINNATAQDMAAIHADRISYPARALRFVEGFDGAMEAGSRDALVHAAIRDELAAVLCEREPLASTVPNPYARWEPLPSPAHYRVRTALPRIVGSDLVPADAIDEARRRALAKLDDDQTWADVHHTQIVHPLSRVFVDHAETLDPAPVSMGGDGDTPQAGSEEVGLRIVHSSVARYVFDLGDWDKSGWVVPLGASGHPDSPHYADQAQAWSRVELAPMLYTWELIAKGAESRQLLEPAK